jgi:acetylornithine aminotransferase
MTSSEKEASYFFHTYKRLSLEIERGEGVHLYASDGTRYLDFLGGIAVNALGYAHPKVLAAINDQAKKYIHLSNYFLMDPQIELAELLVKHSGFKKVFFCNSGSEAIEGALKLSRRWGLKQNKTEIISFSNAFHGRTMGALSMMDRPKYRDGYDPFLPNFRVLDFNAPLQLELAISEKTAAVVLEFIQGEGGVDPVSKEFVAELKRLKEKFGFLIVADEIQAGLGRTGKFFGFQHYDIQPDVVTLAKPLGGGLPLGAVLGSEAVADVFEPGVHGTTFGGNPVACAAGIVVVKELMDNGVMENAKKVGHHFISKLRELQKSKPDIIKEVRGMGLMVGVNLTHESDSVVAKMRDLHVLANSTNNTVVRLLPPLIVTNEHADEAAKSLGAALSA